MKIIHAYVEPRKQKGARCETCRFAEPTRTIGGEEALLCTERMWDPMRKRCYLPKEEANNENP